MAILNGLSGYRKKKKKEKENTIATIEKIEEQAIEPVEEIIVKEEPLTDLIKEEQAIEIIDSCAKEEQVIEPVEKEQAIATIEKIEEHVIEEIIVKEEPLTALVVPSTELLIKEEPEKEPPVPLLELGLVCYDIQLYEDETHDEIMEFTGIITEIQWDEEEQMFCYYLYTFANYYITFYEDRIVTYPENNYISVVPFIEQRQIVIFQTKIDDDSNDDEIYDDEIYGNSRYYLCAKPNTEEGYEKGFARLINFTPKDYDGVFDTLSELVNYVLRNYSCNLLYETLIDDDDMRKNKFYVNYNKLKDLMTDKKCSFKINPTGERKETLVDVFPLEFAFDY